MTGKVNPAPATPSNSTQAQPVRADGAAVQHASSAVDDPTTVAVAAGADTSATLAGADLGDELLIAAAARGDRMAFRVLFDRYHARAYALALGTLRDPEAARDVVQEGFLRAYRGLSGFSGKSKFYTWLYRIIMNLCIDEVRARKRYASAEDESTQDALAGRSALAPIMGATDAGPERQARRIQARKAISAALEALSEEHRTVFVLREVDGLSYAEIADIVGIPKGTVMSRLFHARRRLQEMLGEHLDFVPSDEAGDGDEG